MRLGMGRKQALWLLPALVLGAVVVAGCGVSGGTGGGAGSAAAATPTATPSASVILQKASAFKITSADLAMTFNGTADGKAITGTFEEKLTETPKRSDTTFSFTSGGQQFEGETISDDATNATYTKLTQPSILNTGKWIKSSGTGASGMIDPSTFTDFKDVTNAKLVGTDNINGVAVWHLTGTSTGSGSDLTGDVYIAQSDYHPVRMSGKVGGSTPATVSIDYKAVNSSSISISLPPADQVQSA